MRAPLLLSLSAVAVIAVAAPRAHAAPFELHDRGDRVEIVARGWTAVDPSAVVVTRERLELVVAGGLAAARQSYEDPTVRRVEVRGREPRLLSIKLRGDHDRVAALAPLTTVTQVDDAIVVVIPRAVPRPAAAAPVAAPLLARPTAADAAPATPPAATPSVATPPPPAVASAPAAAPSTTTPAAAPPARVRVGGAAATTGARWWMLLVGLALVGGGGALVARRKQKAPVAASRIEVIDSRSLGGKARVVWLGAGDRELVVAVGPQQVRLLGQWRRAPHALDVNDPADGPALPVARGSATRLAAVPASPAVSGILRLRDWPAPLADDIATGDDEADEQWARDILAATGGRR